MSRVTERRWRVVPLGVAAALAVLAAIVFRILAVNSGSRLPAEPFRIAGNLYYVGAVDVTAFLLTGPRGHVLIDGGYPLTAPMIKKSIAALGFDIADVKVLLNSHAHFDHAGGLAALQEASGAELWVSDADADFVAAGRNGAPSHWSLRFLDFIEPVRVRGQENVGAQTPQCAEAALEVARALVDQKYIAPGF